MNLKDTVGLSLRNLKQSRLRTALTMLGVSIGIASLAGMVSLGIGLQEQTLGRFMQSGLFGSITVTSQSGLPGGLAQLGGARGLGRGGRGRGNPGGPSVPGPKLDDTALKQLAALDHVRDVYPNLRIPLEVSLDGHARPVSAVAVPMSSKNEGAFQTLTYGTFFGSESEDSCMMSLDAAKEADAANPGGLIGKSLTLSYPAGRGVDSGLQVQRIDRQCRIVGIVERSPGPAGPGGMGVTISGVMLPMATAKAIDAEIVTNAQSLLRDPTQAKTYGTIIVKVAQAQFTQDVEDRIRGLGYTAFSIDDALRGAKNAFILLDIFLSLIGSIALAVSSLGIVNTMVMSILERTREIGIMKAVGASDDDIRLIFLIEASVIGLLGGLVGITLGWGVGQVINVGANIYIRSQGGTAGNLFSLPWWLIAGAIVFSMLVSLIAGSYPASRAAKLDPIRALRHD